VRESIETPASRAMGSSPAGTAQPKARATSCTVHCISSSAGRVSPLATSPGSGAVAAQAQKLARHFTVVEFEQDRRIAWQTVLSGPLGRFLGGRIWRYELEPVDGGTKVTESWDLSEDKQAFFLKNPKIGQHTAASMSKTLDRLAEITAS